MTHPAGRTLLATAAGAAAIELVGYGSGDPADAVTPGSQVPRGQKVFIAAGFAVCHTLRDAGSTGPVGTNLDRATPDAEHVERFVTNGGVGMPAFDGVLNRQDILPVSRYVSRVSGS